MVIHNLKGVSGNIGATEIHMLSIEIEQSIKDHDTGKVNTGLTELDEKINSLIDSIHSKITKANFG